ncbi:MAG: hypothetical protein NWF07_13335 [Candidatus Bathyarchaeota archaeon]|nr:hypothetical protein [Candidatus Bathyarchaeota archaeon]
MSNRWKRHLKPLILVTLAVFLLGLSVWRTQQRLNATQPRAIIIDPLHNIPTELNFTEKASELLLSNGYKVNTIIGDEVTVEALKQVSDHELVVLRVHSGIFDEGVWFFTCEEFDGSKYVLEQLSGEVHIATCPSDPRLLFAVGSRFVAHYLRELDGSLVVLMGCDGLSESDLAGAFVESGAVGVVGWDGPVTLDASDEAVLGFLELYLGGVDVGDVVDVVSGDVFNASLVFYGG